LNAEEWGNLKSKVLTSSWGGKNKLPKAFTEKGLYMLATIFKSPKAAQKNIAKSLMDNAASPRVRDPSNSDNTIVLEADPPCDRLEPL
jgi:hypothetical protein